MHDTNIKTHCNDQTLLQLMNLLEIELSSRSHEDDEERRRQGQANTMTGAMPRQKARESEARKEARVRTKRIRKKELRTQEIFKGGASSDKKPVCPDYLTDRGCPKGDRWINARCCTPGSKEDVSAAVARDTISPLVGDLLGTKHQLPITEERLHHHKGKEKARQDLSLRVEVVKAPMQHGHLKPVWK